MKKGQISPSLPRIYARLIPPLGQDLMGMTARPPKIRIKKEEIKSPKKKVPKQYHMCPVNDGDRERYQ
jgi:hypothetical protein